MTARRSRSLGALLVLAVPGAAAAQTGLAIGTGEWRGQGRPPAGMVTLAPQLGATVSGLEVWTGGQLALVNTGATRSSLAATLRTRQPMLLGVSPTLTLRGQDDALASDVRNRRVDGALGVSIGSATLGATAGVGVARSVHASTSRTVQTTNADVHLARGAFQLRLGYVGNAFDAPAAMPSAQGGFSLSRTRLSDLTSDVTWRMRRVEIGGFMGRRLGGGMTQQMWGGGFATVNLNDRLAVVARQETVPSDPTRHLASQRLATIGFRIRPSLSRARFDDGSDAAQFRREFLLSQVNGVLHALRVYLPGATTVEVAGSFNDWTPAAMRSTGRGWWEVVLPLPAGLHSLNVRADGGKWMVPPGLDTATDEFSGAVGVIHIP